jgi:hypothetical protein
MDVRLLFVYRFISPTSVFHDLIQSQTSIGCNRILRGRISILWAKPIDEALSSMANSHRSSSGHLWVKSMIHKFWERLFVLWEERNAVVHGADSSEWTKCREGRLLRETPSPACFPLRSAPTLADDGFCFVCKVGSALKLSFSIVDASRFC